MAFLVHSLVAVWFSATPVVPEVAPGTPCVDGPRLGAQLERLGVGGTFSLHLRGHDGAVVLEMQRPGRAPLQRTVPVGVDGCASVERVVVALISAWARPALPVVPTPRRAQDGGSPEPRGQVARVEPSEAEPTGSDRSTPAPAPSAAAVTSPVEPVGSGDRRGGERVAPEPAPVTALRSGAPDGARADKRDEKATERAGPTQGRAEDRVGKATERTEPTAMRAAEPNGKATEPAEPAVLRADERDGKPTERTEPSVMRAEELSGKATEPAVVRVEDRDGKAMDRAGTPALRLDGPVRPAEPRLGENPSSGPRWRVWAAALGGAGFGSTDAVSLAGTLHLGVSRGRAGVALDAGLESARTQVIEQGRVWAAMQWVSLGPTLTFQPLDGWLIDLGLALRGFRVEAAAEGFPFSSSAVLWSLGGAVSAAVSRRLWGPLHLQLRGFASVRAPSERLTVDNASGALVLGAFSFGGLAGVSVEFAR